MLGPLPVLGGGATEEELRTEELDAALDEDEPDLPEEDEPDLPEEDEPDLTEEDEPDLPEEDEPKATVSDEDKPFCVSELLKPSFELDEASCSESEEFGFVPNPSLLLCSITPSSEEELISPCLGGSAEDKFAPPLLEGSVGSSFWLLQVIKKNTRATIAGRTQRFTVRFINTSRW